MRYLCIIPIIITFITHTCFAKDFIEKKEFYSVKQTVLKNLLPTSTGLKYPGFDIIEQVWEEKKPSVIGKMPSPTIPKIIHQIWIGGNPLPPRYEVYIKECRALHPDWEYRLWTEKEINDWDFPAKDLYLKARNYQEKTNIIRASAVQEFGGIYLDTDILCIKPFDEAIEYYDFFAGLEPNFNHPWLPISNNAFIASKARHPILDNYFEQLRANWDINVATYEEQKVKEQPLKYLLERVSLNNSFPQFTRSIIQHLSSANINDRAIMLPTDYIFPFFLRHKRNSKEDLNKFTLSVHDYTKNLRLIEFIPLKFAIAKHSQKTKHYVLGSQYKKFTKADYRPNTIPKIMHFVNMREDNLSPQWKEGMYRTWQQKFWNKEDIYSIADKTEKSLLDRTNSPKALELLGGLIILNKLGGVYLDNKAVPGKENFFDLIYSLDFFAGLTKMETENPTASHKAIGVRPQHEITMRILEKLDQKNGEISLATLQDIILQKGYEYINIDGINTFLPQQYFEPKENEEYSILK